jgi:glycosyltransferase involved in cell wall biosynthesis
VVIATRIFPPDVGAAAFRLAHLAQALAHRGVSVDVLTTRPRGPDQAVHLPGVAVSRWPVHRDSTGNVRGYLEYLSFDGPLALRLLTRRPPAVTIAEPPPTTGAVVRAACAVQRRPYVYYAADVWSDGVASTDAPVWLVRLLRRLELSVLSAARVVLSTSPAVTDRLTQLGVPRSRLVLVGNGVDVGVFRPDGTTPAPGVRYFVYAGTISEWQGVEVFLHALRRLPAGCADVRLVVLGSGVDEQRLRDVAATAVPGRVDFLGQQPPRVAAAWIRGAVASLASLRPDGQYQAMTPTKIYAAAASGVPALFAGTGGGADLVREHALGVVTDHDEHSVASAMADILADPGPRPVRRLVDWARAHGSLEAVAQRAADAVIAAAQDVVDPDQRPETAYLVR